MRIKLIAVLMTGVAAVSQAQNAAQKPLFQRAPDALERVSWRTRALVGDDRLTNWRLAISTSTLDTPTFLEGVVRTEAAVVDFVEGASTQKVSAQLSKNLDHTLTTEERAALKVAMGPVRLLSYLVEELPREAAGQRRVFEFAKEMGVETIVVPIETDLADTDRLATEFSLNVAVLGAPDVVLKALEERSKRLGVGLSTRLPIARETLAEVGPRLNYVRVRGPGMNAEFFHELNRLNIRPLVLALDATGGRKPLRICFAPSKLSRPRCSRLMACTSRPSHARCRPGGISFARRRGKRFRRPSSKRGPTECCSGSAPPYLPNPMRRHESRGSSS